MDFRVWNPVPPDWEFAVVSVKPFWPRLGTVQDSKNALAPQKVCCLQRLIMLVLNFDVLLRWILAVHRHSPHSVRSSW